MIGDPAAALTGYHRQRAEAASAHFTRGSTAGSDAITSIWPIVSLPQTIGTMATCHRQSAKTQGLPAVSGEWRVGASVFLRFRLEVVTACFGLPDCPVRTPGEFGSTRSAGAEAAPV